MKFYKYQGTGNDFIMVDNRALQFHAADKARIAMLCHRRFGIGADGLILLQNEPGYDFKMVYFNADGGESTMCGNGGRCLVAFAAQLGIISNKARFLAIDGPHEASISNGLVNLHMSNVSNITQTGQDYFLNTGSPHYVKHSLQVEAEDVFTTGRQIRYSAPYAPTGGTNVNFMEVLAPNHIKVRTYERGVEDETLSCGTGVTASAIVNGLATGRYTQLVDTPGGQLQVSFTPAGSGATNIILTGPATYVFEGEIDSL